MSGNVDVADAVLLQDGDDDYLRTGKNCYITTSLGTSPAVLFHYKTIYQKSRPI